jgi:hypothetical protein
MENTLSSGVYLRFSQKVYFPEGPSYVAWTYTVRTDAPDFKVAKISGLTKPPHIPFGCFEPIVMVGTFALKVANVLGLSSTNWSQCPTKFVASTIPELNTTTANWKPITASFSTDIWLMTIVGLFASNVFWATRADNLLFSAIALVASA